MGFLAWIKNGTKGTYGLQMPAFYPASRVTHESVSVTADGVKDRNQLQYELAQLIDSQKVSCQSLMSLSGIYYQLYRVKDGNYYFTASYPHTNGATVEQAVISLTQNDNSFQRVRGTTLTDLSTEVPQNGFVYEVIY